MPGAPPHWIRPNHATRSPHCWVYLDTESAPVESPGGAVQRWTLGVTCHDHQGRERGVWRDPEWAVHETPGELWRWIDARAVPRGRTVVIAHNLAFDLRISRAFSELPALGWALDRIRLDGDGCTARWRRGAQTLQMIDTLTWVPAPLAALGMDVGIDKAPLPAWAADRSEWEQRCLTDVLILQAVWRRIVGFVWREELGSWQPTGAGQAWAGWRHRFYDVPVLAAQEPELVAMERRACWGGRAEAWRWGRQQGGPFTEWDLEAAYLRIMRECDLPGRWVGRRRNPSDSELVGLAGRFALCSHVKVTTEIPVVPAEVDGGIVWPVGTFTTTLWEPELELALAHAESVEVVETNLYERAPVLRSFANWLWPMVVEDPAGVDPVVRRVAKHWSRAIVGRFGVTYPVWQVLGDALGDDVTCSRWIDADTGERGRLLCVGGRSYLQLGREDGENAVPAIMGWIMAECRRRLWVAMEAAGLDNVVHVDTDGLLVTARGDWHLARAHVDGLRRKKRYRKVEVFGPRQLLLGGELRASGVPRRAQRVGPRSWVGEVWPSLGQSIAEGDPEGVKVLARRFVLRGTDRRRVHKKAGQTAAVAI